MKHVPLRFRKHDLQVSDKNWEIENILEKHNEALKASKKPILIQSAQKGIPPSRQDRSLSPDVLRKPEKSNVIQKILEEEDEKEKEAPKEEERRKESAENMELLVTTPKKSASVQEQSISKEEQKEEVPSSPALPEKTGTLSDGEGSSKNKGKRGSSFDLKKSLMAMIDEGEGLYQDINVFAIFKPDKIGYLWKLWEIMLTNQPLLVVHNNPGECSDAVFGLLSLISPIEYTGDFRPYFTVYDSDYRVIQEAHDKNCLSNIIIGVTNPLFMKTLTKFSHVLHLEKEHEKSKREIFNMKIFGPKL